MKKENPVLRLIFRLMSIPLFIISLTLSSCQENDESLNYQETNIVDIQSAQGLIDNLSLSSTNSNARTSKKFKKIESIFPISDEEGAIVYYVVNYENGGFIVLSGDNRTHPILAYSAESAFPMDLEEYPEGLVGWLVNEKEYIKEIRKSNKKQLKEIAKLWKKGNIEDFLSSGLDGKRMPPEGLPDDNDENCHVTSVYGPLLETTWNQGCGYNDLLNTCSSARFDQCGRVWTGCVATAMAQVIRFHQFPNNYNWLSMPNNAGSPETSRLMRDIGNAVGMDYGCDGSAADTKAEVASSFRNDFGYSSASYSDYSSSEIVKTNLRFNRPVVFRGGSQAHWLIFPYYTGGHAWVCDGFRSTYDCTYGTYLYYHMNWGWGSWLDGWYANNNWSNSNGDFNYKKGVVYNIIP